MRRKKKWVVGGSVHCKAPSVYEVHNSYAQNGKDHAKSEE